MNTFKRFCFSCQRRTLHVRHIDRYGHQRDTCGCGHVNSTWWAELLRRPERPLGATLRTVGR
jgi:hypothetical protein